MECLIRASVLATVCAVAYSQALPGTSQDRVGYPEGYRDTFTLLYSFDRPDTKRILVTYGNDRAVSVQRGEQGNYPYGSIIVQETWTAQLDAQGNPVLDSSGRFQRDLATGKHCCHP